MFNFTKFLVVASVLMAVSLADPCGDTYKDQTACDANTTCTWCKCGALPSACWTKENAANLPAGVYICDSKNASILSEAEFLRKWAAVVTAAPLNDVRALKSLLPVTAATEPAAGENPWDMLNNIIQQITGDWTSIVNAFKTSYSEQLDSTELARGWSKFKEATKVFKGEGLDYDKAPAFFADIRKMISVPDKYASDFDSIIEFIQFFDKEYWSEHDTTFSIGKGGDNTHFTMMANNNNETSKIDVLFLTISEEFKLAPDIFVITESHSYLGGIFSSQKIKFEKKKAAITDEELTFVSTFFLLQAYQEIATAQGLSPPPDPSFPPSPSPPVSP